MISCDRCGKELCRASLSNETYAVVCEKPLEARAHYTPSTTLAGYLQLCTACHDILLKAVATAVHKCLAQETGKST